jgi:hypothetical protein
MTTSRPPVATTLRGRHMRTLQERTCAHNHALCLRHIHTSAHQRAPHDIEARALVVGPAATVRRCSGQSGRPRRNSRCPSHAGKKCYCEEPGARCCEAADGQCRAAESLLRPGSTTQRISPPTPVFEWFRTCVYTSARCRFLRESRRQANTSTGRMVD